MIVAVGGIEPPTSSAKVSPPVLMTLTMILWTPTGCALPTELHDRIEKPAQPKLRGQRFYIYMNDIITSYRLPNFCDDSARFDLNRTAAHLLYSLYW